jgi:hypothetical protein
MRARGHNPHKFEAAGVDFLIETNIKGATDALPKEPIASINRLIGVPNNQDLAAAIMRLEKRLQSAPAEIAIGHRRRAGRIERPDDVRCRGYTGKHPLFPSRSLIAVTIPSIGVSCGLPKVKSHTPGSSLRSA